MSVWGTFRPVKEDEITDHIMHSEYYIMDEETAGIINDTRAAGGKIWAVGTTASRTLETIAADDGTGARTVRLDGYFHLSGL